MPCGVPRANCLCRSPSAAECARSADAAVLFEAGADKITMNSAAVRTPELITEVAERFGSQAVVVAIDAKRGQLRSEEAEVYVSGGRIPTGLRMPGLGA